MFGSSSDQPTPVYVFVTTSLAAFLSLFLLCKQPQSQFNAYTTAPLTHLDDGAFQAPNRNEYLQVATTNFRAELLSAERVLQSLVSAGMLAGDAKPEMLTIAEEIASRMRVSFFADQGKNFMRVVLLTEHPESGKLLLDQMMSDTRASLATENLSFSATPAIASRINGTAIEPSNLLLLILCSIVVGVGGLVLLEHSRETILLSEKDVLEVSQLPVIADFSNDDEIPQRKVQLAWQRRLRLAVGAAEVVLAAAILLVIFRATTSQPFANLLVNDPLAAYGQAVTQLLG